MEELYEGIIDKDIYQKFDIQKGYDLYSHACNGCIIEDYIAIANILSPEFIEIENHIFIAELFEQRGQDAIETLEKLKSQFKNVKADVERWVNCRSIGDFFKGQNSPILDDIVVLEQLCLILEDSWEKQLRKFFPNRFFAIEYGMELMGELGLAITVYEVTDVSKNLDHSRPE